jgi:membrane-bound ClpP family serine protease
MLITLVYSAAGTGLLVIALRRKKRVYFLFPGILIILAGTVLLASEMLRTPALLAVGGTLLAIGARRLAAPSAQPEGPPPSGPQGAV